MGYISKGGTGFRVERFKFLLYLIAPIGAVYVYSLPAVHEAALTNVRASALACQGWRRCTLQGERLRLLLAFFWLLRCGSAPDTDMILHRQIA
jgi:hypothetical protein